MNIREIISSDQQPIARVFQQAFNGPPWNERWSEKAALAVIDEWIDQPQFYGLAAVIDDEIVGIVFGRIETWDRNRHFLMKELCVLPSRQRTGIGSALAEALEQRLEEKGVNSLYLHTLKDSPAATFYLSAGYRASERMVTFTKTIADRATKPVAPGAPET